MNFYFCFAKRMVTKNKIIQVIIDTNTFYKAPNKNMVNFSDEENLKIIVN